MNVAQSLNVFSNTSPSLTEIPVDADLVIVGGGIVGATLACCLADCPLRIVILDAHPPSTGLANRRAYALNLLTADIFTGLGIWHTLKSRITGFTQIALSDEACPEIVRFSPPDIQRDELGYVAEHGVIVEALYDRLRSAENITWIAPAQVHQLHHKAGETGEQVAVEFTLTNGESLTIHTPLVAAADGANSPLRQALGIQTWGWKYWQSCVGFTIKSDRSHHNIAYEKFWQSGPFAMLPLPHQRCQVVWTAPHDEAQKLTELDEPAFLELLAKRYGVAAEDLHLDTPRRIFPVRLMQGKTYIAPRVVLLGDAAHCCHPVGGQGMNLGIRDAATLAEILQRAQQQGKDWGELTVIRQYDRWRRWQNSLILALTDTLDRAFSNQIPAIVLGRRLMLMVLQRSRFLRYVMLRVMTGHFGRIPHIAKGKHAQ